MFCILKPVRILCLPGFSPACYGLLLQPRCNTWWPLRGPWIKKAWLQGLLHLCTQVLTNTLEFSRNNHPHTEYDGKVMFSVCLFTGGAPGGIPPTGGVPLGVPEPGGAPPGVPPTGGRPGGTPQPGGVGGVTPQLGGWVTPQLGGPGYPQLGGVPPNSGAPRGYPPPKKKKKLDKNV